MSCVLGRQNRLSAIWTFACDEDRTARQTTLAGGTQEWNYDAAPFSRSCNRLPTAGCSSSSRRSLTRPETLTLTLSYATSCNLISRAKSVVWHLHAIIGFLGRRVEEPINAVRVTARKGKVHCRGQHPKGQRLPAAAWTCTVCKVYEFPRGRLAEAHGPPAEYRRTRTHLFQWCTGTYRRLNLYEPAGFSVGVMAGAARPGFKGADIAGHHHTV
nr:hypothetical protein CFP56_32253 [Quercus suber]